MSLRELYQEMILDHGRHPRHFGELTPCQHRKDGYNPLCGDKLTVMVSKKNNKIDDIMFQGTGCAISMASASLMCEAMKGKTEEEARVLFAHFHTLVTRGEMSGDALGKLAVFAGVFEFPARVKCASLAWHTLIAALNNTQESVSTE